MIFSHTKQGAKSTSRFKPYKDMVFYKSVLLKAPLFKHPLATNLSKLILTNSESK